MIYKSAEIRWWSTEKKEMWDWCVDNLFKGNYLEPEERTDYYLKTTDKRIGAKWREGKLEFKFRTAKYEHSAGWMEEYVKESSSSELKRNELPIEAMVSVAKKRYMQIVVPHHGCIKITEDTTVEGCQIEFTEVEIGNHDMLYTIGFEAFSEEGSEIDVLSKTIDFFPLTKDIFRKENSEGYAAKIKRAHLTK